MQIPERRGGMIALAKIAVIAFLAVAVALLSHSVALLIADLQLPK